MNIKFRGVTANITFNRWKDKDSDYRKSINHHQARQPCTKEDCYLKCDNDCGTYCKIANQQLKLALKLLETKFIEKPLPRGEVIQLINRLIPLILIRYGPRPIQMDEGDQLKIDSKFKTFWKEIDVRAKQNKKQVAIEQETLEQVLDVADLPIYLTVQSYDVDSDQDYVAVRDMGYYWQHCIRSLIAASIMTLADELPHHHRAMLYDGALDQNFIRYMEQRVWSLIRKDYLANHKNEKFEKDDTTFKTDKTKKIKMEAW